MTEYPNIERLIQNAGAALTVTVPAGGHDFLAVLRTVGDFPDVVEVKGAGLGAVLGEVEKAAGHLRGQWPQHYADERVSFTKGQRVVLVAQEPDSDPGMVGTVMENSSAPWVWFDSPTRYKTRWHDLPGSEQNTDCVDGRSLRLLVDQTPNPAHTALNAWNGL